MTRKTKTEEPALFGAPNSPEAAAAATVTAAVAGAQEPKPAKLPARREAKARAVAKPEPARVIPMTDPGEIMSMIERVATNRDVDPEKLERILALQERLLDRNARLAFNRSFVEMSPELPIVTRDGRIIVQEKTNTGRRDGEVTQNTPYAKWETIDELVKPVLHAHGFALSHRIATAPDNRVRVTAILRHIEGHIDDSCYFDLPADTTGSKNNAQAWASAVSYAKRHTGCAALNIITKAEDDDGKSSGRAVVLGKPIDVDQLERLTEYAKAVGADIPKFIEYLNKGRPKGHPEITKLEDLPESRFGTAIDALRDRDAAKNAPKKQGEGAGR